MSLDPHKWVATHADYLYAFAVSRINDTEQARDLVQETFLSALQNAAGFAGKSSERTWLTAILKNKIIDVYRKKSSLLKIIDKEETGHHNDDFFEEDNGHWKTGHLPQAFGIEDKDHLITKEFDDVLKKCMEKLPVLWRAVFTMKHIDDEPTGIICAQLKVTPANFWVIIHRTKVNLRACLQKNWI
jgi:RNA polymerase sigma-70 factor (TIGR02943 family)